MAGKLSVSYADIAAASRMLGQASAMLSSVAIGSGVSAGAGDVDAAISGYVSACARFGQRASLVSQSRGRQGSSVADSWRQMDTTMGQSTSMWV